MEELRQIAFAYYKDVPEHVKMWVQEFLSEIDRDGNEKVSLQEFLAYMGMHEDSKHLCTPSFFDELKQEGREELEFIDLLALFYIVSTGRPFCSGHCKNFIKGGYFTCVQCFYHSPKTFDLCAVCYLDGKYVHRHKNFLDDFLVLKTKRAVGDNLNQHGEASSITSKAKAPESGTGSTPAETMNSSRSSSSSSSSLSFSSSTTTATTAESTNDSTSSGTLTPRTSSSTTTSNALVPVNPRRNDTSAGRKALKAIEILLAVGNIFVTSSQCTIM
ncbi:hypothetical protein PRUPE_1G049600 [Prunus persica]|uniref:EF-hand domain-containing protein n=1 Tax=Prunus persica TaxID=3760 RepID=A0A251QSP7_PRUPE|nr:bypass of stop codon protein 1 [Prunus persica]ONI26842.1 hypothetical protein PRUPE_1G049600 [Prunus persica]